MLSSRGKQQVLIIMKILFQGDSITDAGRNLGNGSLIGIGQGYAMLCAAELSVKHPNQFSFLNFGCSGNRIVDVYARIKVDGWNHAPDVFSLLIGVNDVWHELEGKNGVETDRFYRIYKMLVTDTLNACPNVKMILMEPFFVGDNEEDEGYIKFLSEVKLRAQVVRQVAEETQQIFLPLQKMFEDARAIAPAAYWVGDGVHPTIAGHRLIANEWMRVFNEKILGA